jgi:predicted transcriptional regulator
LGQIKQNVHFRAPSGQLGPLEQRLLETIWTRHSATIRELVDDGYDDLAYTTVLTTLDRLFTKNLLTRKPEGRAFRYAPRFTREELRREITGEAFRQLLDASPVASMPLSDLVEILIQRDQGLLDQLGQLIEARRGEFGGELRAKKQAAP